MSSTKVLELELIGLADGFKVESEGQAGLGICLLHLSGWWWERNRFLEEKNTGSFTCLGDVQGEVQCRWSIYNFGVQRRGLNQRYQFAIHQH